MAEKNIVKTIVALVGYSVFFSIVEMGLTQSEIRDLGHVDTVKVGTAFFAPPREDFEFCNKFNFMQLERDGEIGRNANNSLEEFSMQMSDFGPHHGRACSSSSEIVNAVRNGSRVFPSANLTWQQKEQTHSVFVPADCDIPARSHYDMCDDVNRFSHIVIQGDSLSRHLMKGLALTLTNDMIRGATFSGQETPHKCHCDSQFTEKHGGCNSEIQFTWNVRPWQRNMCPRVPTADQVELVYNVNRLHKGVYRFPGVPEDCSQEKPILLIVQGGLHLRYNAQGTFDGLIMKFFTTPVVQECIRRNNIIFVWCAASFQSPRYHDLFPAQRDENAIRFNAEIEELFVNNNITNVGTLNWSSFSKGAWFSDGLHFMTQVNYWKAQHVMALATKMLDEGKFLQKPR